MSNGKGSYEWLHSHENLKLFELGSGWKIRSKASRPVKKLLQHGDANAEVELRLRNQALLKDSVSEQSGMMDRQQRSNITTGSLYRVGQ